MQKINIRRQLRKVALGTVILGAGAFAGFPQMANAASRDVKEARRDVKEARKDVRDAKREVRKADTRSERQDAREDLRDARDDKHDARQDLRQEKREDQHVNDSWNNNRNNNHWDNNRYYDYNRGHVYNNGTSVWSNWINAYGTYTGVVTRVASSRSFEVRANGQSFDVYTDASLPHGFDKGDTVRVYGVRSGGNDIRNASVSIINNR